MAGPLEFKSSFEEGGPSPLYQFAQGLELRGPTSGELLQESGKITERRATRMEDTAKKLETEAAERAKLSTEQAEERKRERPAPYEPPATPDLSARPFLSPPASVLGQLQTALVGIGQLAQGIGGLKGKGYAIGATAALKGALEGWQAGDQERAQRAFEQWQAKTQTLLAAHRSRRERYQDILDDQTRTMQDRLSQISLEARIAEFQDLGDAARSGEIDRVLTVLEKQRAEELHLATLTSQIARWNITHEATEANRAEIEKRAKESQRALQAHREKIEGTQERRTKIYEQQTGQVLKLQTQDISLTNKLKTADLVEEAVKVMSDRGLLATGPTTPDAFRAWLGRQTAFNDPRVKWARDTIERQGTPLVVGSEIALGEPASALRLKAVLEPQAGHILTASPQFWDTFFRRYRPFLREQQTMVREHLRASGHLQAPVEEREVVEQ